MHFGTAVFCTNHGRQIRYFRFGRDVGAVDRLPAVYSVVGIAAVVQCVRVVIVVKISVPILRTREKTNCVTLLLNDIPRSTV